MADPYTYELDGVVYGLSVDEERGAYYGRWSCGKCGKAGISEKTCSSEDEALAAVRYEAGLHGRGHVKGRRNRKS